VHTRDNSDAHSQDPGTADPDTQDALPSRDCRARDEAAYCLAAAPVLEQRAGPDSAAYPADSGQPEDGLVESGGRTTHEAPGQSAVRERWCAVPRPRQRACTRPEPPRPSPRSPFVPHCVPQSSVFPGPRPSLKHRSQNLERQYPLSLLLESASN